MRGQVKGLTRKRKDSSKEVDEKSVTFGKSTKQLTSKKAPLEIQKVTEKTTTKNTETRTKSIKKNTTLDQSTSKSGEKVHNFIFKKLKDSQLYEVSENHSNSQQMVEMVRERVEKTYRAINSAAPKTGGDNADLVGSESKKIANLKVTRKTLINYLKKRYTARVATKMACMFDWSN